MCFVLPVIKFRALPKDIRRRAWSSFLVQFLPQDTFNVLLKLKHVLVSWIPSTLKNSALVISKCRAAYSRAENLLEHPLRQVAYTSNSTKFVEFCRTLSVCNFEKLPQISTNIFIFVRICQNLVKLIKAIHANL